LNFYLLLPVIEIVFCLALIGLLVFKGRQHVARKPFGFFLVCMAAWGICIFCMRASESLQLAAFWENFVFAAILSAAICFYWFTTSITGSHKAKKLLWVLLSVTAVVIALIPTGLIFKGMQHMWYGKAPVIAPLFPLYVLCVYVPLAIGMTALIKYCRTTRNVDERIRNEYIVAGVIAMFVGGTTDYLPALGLGMYPLGIIGNIAFCILATIAMLKYGLMEIQVVLRKGAAYSLVSALIFGIFGSIILLLTIYFQNRLNPLSLTITITVVFLIAAIFQPLLSRSQTIVDRMFFRQRYDYLQALRKFAREKEGDLDLNELSVTLVTTMANSMQSQGVYLLLPSAVNRNFETIAFSGNKRLPNITISATAPLAITMKYQDSIVDSQDMDIIPALSNLAENDRKILTDSNIEMMMPLRKEGQCVGILMLSRKVNGESYSNEDKQILQSLSDHISVRIDNASRFSSIKQAHSDLQRTMEGIISAVSAVVESRDPYTAGHQRRVAELARAIAGEMGLSDWHQKGMHIIGLLHDVGKIAVPAEILSKPGKISQYEFNIIKNHSQVGYDILEKVEFPWPVAKAILQHHERVNGSGYPYGLVGEGIALEARILGVADVVEAMSSHRPYRPAIGLQSALSEIRKQAGILYDPEVVEACLRLLETGDFAFEKLMSAANPKEKEAVMIK
jgi:putative nucleotidyltransferase with HDIG domain